MCPNVRINLFDLNGVCLVLSNGGVFGGPVVDPNVSMVTDLNHRVVSVSS